MSTIPQYPKDPNTPVSNLPFSPAVRVGDLIFVSRQTSVDAKGTIIQDMFEGEFRRSVKNLRNVIKGADSILEDVIQTRNYVRHPANVARYNELYANILGRPICHALPTARVPQQD